MPITITPVLSSSVGYLEDVRDQIATLMRFIIMNPGWTSSLWEKDMVSFRSLSAAHEADRSEMSGVLHNRVSSLLNRMFTDYQFDCEFKTSEYDEKDQDGRYAIGFNILITKIGQSEQTQMPGLLAGTITVDKKTNSISLDYEKNQDSAMLSF